MSTQRSKGTGRLAGVSAAGFTYLGILLFLAIIALASSMTLEVASVASRRSKERELRAIGREFQVAFQSYYQRSPAGAPRFPRALTDLVKDPRFANVQRHLRRIYPDPLTGEPQWGTIAAPSGGIMAVYSLAPGDPIGEFNEHFLAPEAENGAHKGYASWIFGYDPLAMAVNAVSF